MKIIVKDGDKEISVEFEGATHGMIQEVMKLAMEKIKELNSGGK